MNRAGRPVAHAFRRASNLSCPALDPKAIVRRWRLEAHGATPADSAEVRPHRLARVVGVERPVMPVLGDMLHPVPAGRDAPNARPATPADQSALQVTGPLPDRDIDLDV